MAARSAPRRCKVPRPGAGERAALDHKQLRLAADTVRFLAADAVEQAKSGHPGAPMGLADVAVVLWSRHLKYDPARPDWPDRDRFVLSVGHASMVQYAMLHLTGYEDVSLDEIKRFRQLGSKTPGHPEHGVTRGVEASTGTLGQGLANAVGMAIAERWLAQHFNRNSHAVVDHHTYVFVGDGDLMEGISHEACSLAGHLGLGKLIVLWDDNRISIDGPTSLTTSDDTRKRFEAYGWHTQAVDGHDVEAIDQAIATAREEGARPSLIACHTHIGFGSPNKQDSESSHGAPLGEDEVRATKQALGWPLEPSFLVPDEASAFMRAAAAARAEARSRWEQSLAAYRATHPELAAEYQSYLAGEIPERWDRDLTPYEAGKMVATRQASGAAVTALAARMPNFIGGSADLSGSNKTQAPGAKPLQREDFSGRYIHFGIRENAMCAVLNGMALHGGLRVFGGTFFIFVDYMRPAIRMSALMRLPLTFVFTHDSIGVGEDGPSHHPIEQLMMLRAIPDLTVIRPADANETLEAWRVALERPGPVALCLTRQKIPVLDRRELAPAEGLQRGAYVLAAVDDPQLLLIATGSEVTLALEAQRLLAEQQIRARVVSMPSWEIFAEQPEAYRHQVLPPSVRARVSVEAGISMGWERYLGELGESVAIDHFSVSAPYQDLLVHFGFTAEKTAEVAVRVLARVTDG